MGACRKIATGFMDRHSRTAGAFAFAAALALLGPASAHGADLTLIGTFGDKAAILAVDGGEPRTVRVGQRLGDVLLVAVEPDRATVESEGRRRILVRGQTYSTQGAARQSITLSAGAGGHFFADGQVNGGAIRFVVDTGATAIAIPGADALRLRIDYRKGRPISTRTANGTAQGYLVRLDSVRVGGIELQGVDAIVLEQGLDIALLGNTFLNRTEMRRDGQTMTLIRRF